MNWTDWVGMGLDRTGGWGYRSTYLPTYLLYYQRLVERVGREASKRLHVPRLPLTFRKIEIEGASLGNGIRNGNGKREFGARES